MLLSWFMVLTPMPQFSDDSDKAQQGINRRTFMQATGMAALSAALPTIPLSNNEIVEQAVLKQRVSAKVIFEQLWEAVRATDEGGNIPAEEMKKRCVPCLKQADLDTRNACRLKKTFGLEGEDYDLFTVATWIPENPANYILSCSNTALRKLSLDTPDKISAHLHQEVDKAIQHLCVTIPEIQAKKENEISSAATQVTENNAPNWSNLCADTQNVFHAIRGEQEESRMERLLLQRLEIATPKIV
jgi:hypothetical protein